MQRMLLLAAVILVWMPGRAAGQAEDAQSRLLTAIRMGNAEEVTRALKDGANPAGEIDGGTPMSLAMGYGDVGVVRALVEGGGDLKRATLGEWGPLEFALNAEEASAELLRFLIEKGIKPEGGAAKRDAYLRSPAALRSAPIAQLLLDAGSRADAVVSSDWSIIGLAATRGTAEVVETLLKGGAQHSEQEDGRSAPLLLASGRRDGEGAKVVAALIAAGADASATDKHGWTPITIAASAGAVETVRALVRAGVDVNEAALRGMTPIHCAARYADAEMVRALLELGAKPDVATMDDQFPLELAFQAADLDSEWYAEDPPSLVLVKVARTKPIEKIRALLEAGADPNRAGVNGWTPLMLAAYMWDVSRVGRISEDEERRGAWQRIDDELDGFAAAHDPVEIVRLLALKGAKRQPSSALAAELDIASQRSDSRRATMLELIRALPEGEAAKKGSGKRAPMPKTRF